MYYGSGTVVCSPCSETMTSHMLGRLAGSNERRADVMVAILKIWRHVIDSVNQCIFAWSSILPNFISIRF